MHTGADLLTEPQVDRLSALFRDKEYVEVEVTWGVYQRLIQAYRREDQGRRKELMDALIESISRGVPTVPAEVAKLGRTLKMRAADVLAFFDRPAPPMAPRRQSTAGSNASAAPHSAAATSPTTSPGPCWRPAGSDRSYTPFGMSV